MPKKRQAGDEAENLIVLLFFSQLPVGVAKNSRIGVLGEKSQDSFLPPTSFGDVMLFNERVFTVERNGMKVEIERDAPLEPQF